MNFFFKAFFPHCIPISVYYSKPFGNKGEKNGSLSPADGRKAKETASYLLQMANQTGRSIFSLGGALLELGFSGSDYRKSFSGVKGLACIT